jgi:hypothetical protein
LPKTMVKRQARPKRWALKKRKGSPQKKTLSTKNNRKTRRIKNKKLVLKKTGTRFKGRKKNFKGRTKIKGSGKNIRSAQMLQQVLPAPAPEVPQPHPVPKDAVPVPETLPEPVKLAAISLEHFPPENRDKAVALLFSKDRAMQLDATIRSLYMHISDPDRMLVRVIYTTSDGAFEAQYERLRTDHPQVQWIREANFKEQTLAALSDYPYVLFAVDDCLFFQDFQLAPIMNTLYLHPEAIGFSLRLGTNINYSYSHDTGQAIPDYVLIENGYLKYNWYQGAADFGYPLEVSSSVYRTDDIRQLLVQMDFSNPNTLEAGMACLAATQPQARQFLLCHFFSVAFCNPVNLVQNVFQNRAGASPEYSSGELSRLFNEGYRIDITRYLGLLPNSCHQQMELFF